MPDPLFMRDGALMAVIFGGAAVVWFGWGQEVPPRTWRLLLGVGSGLGLVLALIGGLLTWQNWSPGSALADSEASRAFRIVCGIEFGLAGLGAAVLGVTKRPQWIAPWIAFVVGVHFIPLAFIFGDSGQFGLATLVVIVSGLSVVVHRRAAIVPSAVVGLGSGTAFVLYAVRAIALVLPIHQPPRTDCPCS